MPWRASLPEPASRTRQPLRHANADPASTMGGASPRERSPARRPRSSPAATGRPSLFPTTGASLAPSARRSPAAARALTCPPASAGTARSFQLPAQRCGSPHPAAIRRRVPVQRCLDQRPASGHAALRLHHLLLRPHSASSLRQRAEPRRRARGQLAPAQPALVLRLRNQSPHLAHQHRPGLHRAVGHRRHHSADRCAELPPSKSPRACAIR